MIRLPKRSTILHIRSKDTNLIDLNTHFSVNLFDPVICNQGEICNIQLTSLEMPYSFYNVSTSLKNNTLAYDNSTLTLPSKDYDIDELVRVINADTNFPLTTSFDNFTYKITFTNSTNSDVVLKFSESEGVSKLLGFTSENLTCNANSTLTGANVVNLCSVHSVFIKSSLSTGNVISTRAGNSTTLQKVSVDRNFGDMIYLNQDDHIQITTTTKNVIDHMIIKITDQNDNSLDLNGVNYEMSFLFSIFDNPLNNVGPRTGRRGVEPLLEPERRQLRRELPQPVMEEPTEPRSGEDHDDTHPIEDNTHIQEVAKQTLRDALIERLKSD